MTQTGLSQAAAKGGALVMLSALSAFAVSREPIALIVFPVLISVMQLLCLVQGPWTAPLYQWLPASTTAERRRRL